MPNPRFERDASLGLNPGITFGTGGSGHMRLNLASPRAVIRTALERLEAALRTLLPPGTQR